MKEKNPLIESCQGIFLYKFVNLFHSTASTGVDSKGVETIRPRATR